jgi:hypothetical protein
MAGMLGVFAFIFLSLLVSQLLGNSSKGGVSKNQAKRRVGTGHKPDINFVYVR